jgi:hypothetical protein
MVNADTVTLWISVTEQSEFLLQCELISTWLRLSSMMKPNCQVLDPLINIFLKPTVVGSALLLLFCFCVADASVPRRDATDEDSPGYYSVEMA